MKKRTPSFLKNIFSKTYIASQCNHKTKRFGEIGTKEKPRYMIRTPLNEDGKPDYCINCISEMTIKCAWCGEPIHIGDQITLYSPADPEHKMPEHAIEYESNSKHKQYVGCLRWDCAQSGADMCGLWIPPGKVERFMSPMEKAFSTGEPVIVSDLSKYNG